MNYVKKASKNEINRVSGGFSGEFSCNLCPNLPMIEAYKMEQEVCKHYGFNDIHGLYKELTAICKDESIKNIALLCNDEEGFYKKTVPCYWMV